MAQTVNLWNQELGRVPLEVFEQVDTTSLILAGNGLTELSPEIARLQALRMLDLGHNRLAGLPDALGEITGLSDFLYLHDNLLTCCPSPWEG